MKANEAPEKIYFSGQQQWSNPFIGLIQKCADTDIEYTRTDAFIEKACAWLEKYATYIHPRKGKDECMVNLSRFRDYMKGE